ncbi:MAG: radical SAM family heme chaperone HemW [Natronospirillum sp.]|uniref:radical SAM family heme chaperone HemW n=1 Tax=Natronospirillum sp. TaxID=2812955 RepID=UPI0025FA63DE|nr:radical SAM family heme chaperone HemW [Natronospirillum sp.]MCH8551778.1 radical SAM family heme chaperone HemW [Natronospirillum sp.]
MSKLSRNSTQPDLAQQISAVPLGLYVHFPWCVRKCPYCDFNSHEANGELPAREYVDALLRDLEQEAPTLAGRQIESVFFGGGTPSLISGREVGRVIDELVARDWLAPNAEITLEANPGAVERQYFADYVSAGVNRVSLGVQTFDETALKVLGRIHDTDDIQRAWELLVQLAVPRLNIDLMHGLPGQTPELAVADLDQALRMNPGHISWYQLTIEPNTRFYNQPPTLPDEDKLEAIEQAGRERLQADGYDQYEISAWARPGHASQHNRNYWTFGDYIGIGAGAHGKLTTESGSVRTQRTRMPEAYLRAILGGRQVNQIDTDALPFEYMLNALRLREGVPETLFTARTGLTPDALEPQLTQLRNKGLIHSDRHALTDLGWRFYNDAVGAWVN